jgi:large subunit ribosomal protein L16
MGAGKGAVDFWVAVIRPGNILFELGGVTLELAQASMKLASYKLPIKTKFISKI